RQSRWYCRNRWESRSVPFFIRKPFLETDKGFFVFRNVIPETKPKAEPNLVFPTSLYKVSGTSIAALMLAPELVIAV
ncbi:hypothetical protein ACR782_19695, partial [Sphingobacterium spiritivorum]|uniref:hypothetical protein n=1 Tax=Sphingobacterium spiritivorum TaxID=258 RepID=UPI003DA3B849